MSHDSQFLINHELRKAGFASLSEAGALVPQLAMCVRDHAHFRALLNACEPAERGHIYDALAPNVRFQARPLADYLIENAREAERQQLPTIGEDGHLKPFKVPEIQGRNRGEIGGSDEAIADLETANNAVREAVAKEHLHVVCVVCTREDWFRGVTRQDTEEELRKAGWRAGFKLRDDESGERDQVEVCPRCVKQRAPKMRAA